MTCGVDQAVIATAQELFDARHFPGVVAMCSDALEAEPECVPLLVLRARAHMALRRDLEAQADLRDIIRLEPRCAVAYRLLGELAARRDEYESASIFFREALRLDPDDQAAADWLQIVTSSLRPAAVARQHPAPATAAGRSLVSRPRTEPPVEHARFARGTQSPDRGEHDERPTQPFARGSDIELPRPAKEPPPMLRLDDAPPASRTPYGRPAFALPPRPVTRAPIPELPGFGDYLVATGILSRERLRAAQAYQRSMRVQLSTAIVTLGLATPQRIEWAAVAHQTELARGRRDARE